MHQSIAPRTDIERPALPHPPPFAAMAAHRHYLTERLNSASIANSTCACCLQGWSCDDCVARTQSGSTFGPALVYSAPCSSHSRGPRTPAERRLAVIENSFGATRFLRRQCKIYRLLARLRNQRSKCAYAREGRGASSPKAGPVTQKRIGRRPSSVPGLGWAAVMRTAAHRPSIDERSGRSGGLPRLTLTSLLPPVEVMHRIHALELAVCSH